MVMTTSAAWTTSSVSGLGNSVVSATPISPSTWVTIGVDGRCGLGPGRPNMNQVAGTGREASRPPSGSSGVLHADEQDLWRACEIESLGRSQGTKAVTREPTGQGGKMFCLVFACSGGATGSSPATYRSRFPWRSGCCTDTRVVRPPVGLVTACRRSQGSIRRRLDICRLAREQPTEPNPGVRGGCVLHIGVAGPGHG